MERTQVTGGEDSLQIWMIAANTLNKQSQTANKERFSSSGVERGANNSQQKPNKDLHKVTD
jgi:hypothetical protein